MLVQRFDACATLRWQSLGELCELLIILHRLFSHFRFSDRFDYWAHESGLELCLHRHARRKFEGLQNVECLAIPTLHFSSYSVESPTWGPELERSRVLCVPTTLEFAYYFRYILWPQSRPEQIWSIATLEFVVCFFMPSLGLAWAATRASVSGDCPVLSIKGGVFVSLTSILYCHIEQYNFFAILCSRCYNTSLGSVANQRLRDVDWSLCDPSLYSSDFDTGLVGCVEEIWRAVGNVKNNGALLAGRKVPEITVILLECDLMPFSKWKSLERQLFQIQYPADLEKSFAVVSEEVASADRLPRDLDDETAWDSSLFE